LKSAVDGLIVHGICGQSTQDLFNIITQNYLHIKEPILRQIAIEGVCKMMFSTKLCDDSDPAVVENILVTLLI
jgi:hypothetical protein